MLPPHGVTCFTDPTVDIPIADISGDLCKIAAFLHEINGSWPLVYYHDWWQHDGLHFERFRDDIHKLFAIVGTSRDLLNAVPNEEYVFVGVAPEDHRWYLRFRVEWDEQGSNLIGQWSLTLNETDCNDFSTGVMFRLKSPIVTEKSTEYFKDKIG